MFPAHSPFGPQPVPAGVDVIELPAHVGPLTALHFSIDEGVATALGASASSVADYRDANSTDEGAAASAADHVPVLFIPGYTGSKEDFIDFLPVLGRRGWESWAYSQRGQADSAAPEGQEHYRLDDFTADAIEVLELLGAEDRPMHVVGHSFGGVVARQAAIARPDLFASLTLHSSGPRHFDVDDEARDMMAAAELIGMKQLFIESFPDSAQVPRPHEPLFEMHRQRALATSADNIDAIFQTLNHYPDRTDALAATGLPTHLVVGEHDATWPQEWLAEEAGRLGATLTLIPDAEHNAHLDNPEALANDLDAFWRSVPLGHT